MDTFLISGAGVLLGAAITYLLNILDRRRQRVEKKFDEAIAAIAAARASLQFINNVPPEAGLSSTKAAELEEALRVDGYKRFVQLVADAREALAQVIPERPDLEHYLRSVDAVAQQGEVLIAELRRGPNP